MKTQKMNIMSKKNKKQNEELIEKLNEIQSQLNDIKSDAGVEVEETITFTREQLQDFLVEYTNKVNEYVFDETYNSIDTDEVISLDVDGREINPSINEDTLRDCFMEATSNLDTDIIMEYADEVMSEVGVI